MRPEPRPGRPKPQRDPFLPQLDFDQLHEFFRRLEARSPAEQAAFVRRVNWNLLDFTAEHRLVSWLIARLRSNDPAVAIEVIGKLPRTRRGRFAHRLRPLVEQLPEAVGRELGAALRGAKRPPGPAPAHKPEPVAVAAPAKEASSADLAQLKDFFGKFGGAR